ncbi:hypothetical protein BJY04DRAFT_222892, partial [Aspergillus karnatakaensis]|uniref:uncharacterized protein n=1 Tax=Aspergillus karnatakaensis TaxID=1810916 RepID=UPI003CCD2381
IYFLVIFSIIIHGLSIPFLSVVYQILGVEPEVDPLGPALVRPLSINAHLPPNSQLDMKQRAILMYNRFSRTKFPAHMGWALPHFRSVHTDEREQAFPRVESFQLGTVEGAPTNGVSATEGGFERHPIRSIT